MKFSPNVHILSAIFSAFNPTSSGLFKELKRREKGGRDQSIRDVQTIIIHEQNDQT